MAQFKEEVLRESRRLITPVFLPGESQGRGSLVGCHLLGCTESDTTETTWQQRQQKANYQSILKETNPEYSLEGLMLKQKLQYFGHLMHSAGL